MNDARKIIAAEEMAKDLEAHRVQYEREARDTTKSEMSDAEFAAKVMGVSYAEMAKGDK